MSLTLSLSRGLSLAKVNPDMAEECFTTLMEALRTRQDSERPGIDSFVTCAEAALKVGPYAAGFPTAVDCRAPDLMLSTC